MFACRSWWRWRGKVQYLCFHHRRSCSPPIWELPLYSLDKKINPPACNCGTARYGAYYYAVHTAVRCSRFMVSSRDNDVFWGLVLLRVGGASAQVCCNPTWLAWLTFGAYYRRLVVSSNMITWAVRAENYLALASVWELTVDGMPVKRDLVFSAGA